LRRRASPTEAADGKAKCSSRHGDSKSLTPLHHS